jgi:uncharacterized protein YecT (DUF1311 family)
MIVRLSSILLLAGAFSVPVLAQGNKPAQTRKPVSAYQACLNKAGANDQATSICQNQETERKDRRLVALYKQVLAKADEDEKPRVIKSQRDFLAYRDSRCDYIMMMWGGTEARTQASACAARMTDDRLDDLTHHWEEMEFRAFIPPYVPKK